MGIGHEAWQPGSKESLPYERIVVVGHSLGSIIGYDILTHAFARTNQSFRQVEKAAQPARNALEILVREASETGQELDLEKFVAAQDGARAELIGLRSPWIVSDFITLGAPLTHAEVLMAKDVEDLRTQQAQRILPTCPPELELDLTTKREHFTYWPGGRRDKDDDIEAAFTRIPHHAAHFGYTRWTNLYSPSQAIFWGDIISGPLAEEFGTQGRTGNVVSGIKDVAVMTGDTRPPLFTHTKYWDLGDTDEPPPDHVVALRKALDLARDGG